MRQRSVEERVTVRVRVRVRVRVTVRVRVRFSVSSWRFVSFVCFVSSHSSSLVASVARRPSPVNTASARLIL